MLSGLALDIVHGSIEVVALNVTTVWAQQMQLSSSVLCLLITKCVGTYVGQQWVFFLPPEYLHISHLVVLVWHVHLVCVQNAACRCAPPDAHCSPGGRGA